MKNLNNINSEYDGTNVRQFLARKGVIVVKETRGLGKLSGLYGDALLVSTMVVAIVKGGIRDMSYGIKIERIDEEGEVISAAYIDYDELDELIEGFDFIKDTAVDLMRKYRDYTEVTYSTKDNAQFSFFQDTQQQQQAFIVLEPQGGMTFLIVDDLKKLKEILQSSKTHLESRGAKSF